MRKKIICFTTIILLLCMQTISVFADESTDAVQSLYCVAGGCQTSLQGSSLSRINNITVAASRINGLVVAPGQLVSVSTVILPRTAENGYMEAGVYQNGEVVQGFGGGICQVSSTTYNAVMNAGLIVLSRSPHSMPVHYLPLGQDAAISGTAKDLIFQNPYDTPILIQAGVTGNQLLVNVFVETASMQGRSYKFYANATSSLSADSYRDCYVNGVLALTEYVGKSNYMAPKQN